MVSSVFVFKIVELRKIDKKAITLNNLFSLISETVFNLAHEQYYDKVPKLYVEWCGYN